MTSTLAPFIYDPSTAKFQENIWDVYRTLRDEHPLYVNPDKPEYVLSRFADIWQVTNDSQTFSSVVEEANNFLPQMIYIDPPRHTQLRGLVSKAFTPRRVAGMEPLIRKVARELLSGIAERGSCEAQHEYAAILPSVVIAKMIGVPDEKVDVFRSWTESFLEIQGPEDYLESLGKCYELFADLLAQRRKEPRDDLMSALLAAEADGQRLTEEELLGFCFLLVLAGNDTTSGLIGNSLVLLAQQPDQRAILLQEPGLWPAAVEELNRIESPTQVLPRTTTRETEFYGTKVPAGSRLMLIWGAANHDDRVFDDPERLDVTRTIDRHLAFGHGTHFCLGPHLARLEARVGLHEWMNRFPEYELAGTPRRITSIWARAFGEIPVTVG